MKYSILALVSALIAGCGGAEVAAEQHGLQFVDVGPEAGLDVRQVSGNPLRYYIPESNGCGAAWLDYDGDGDQDLFIGNGAELVYHDDGARLEVVHSAASQLYRNDGGMRFTDVAEEAGALRRDWIQSVTAVDVEGDGDTDLYLGCFGPDVFLRNEGSRFIDATEELGLGNELWATGASFADTDRDGDLDLYVANYCLFDPENPPDGGRRNVIEGAEIGWGPEEENGGRFNLGAPNLYFENKAGRFVDSTQAAGLAVSKDHCSYAAVFSDLDGDGDQDLLVANDLQPCRMHLNRGDGTFEEVGVERGIGLDAEGRATAAMGLCVADVDADGDFDVLKTNFDMESNCLHLNDGQGRFKEVGAQAGLAEASFAALGWGGGFFDADLDGDLDLLVANGHVMPNAEEIGLHAFLQKSQLFEASRGANGALQFREVVGGPGLEPLRSSRGVALGDPDNDGDLDALLLDLDFPPRLLENRSVRRGAWIGFELIGRVPNRDALGARVEVEAGEGVLVREARPVNGLYSTHDKRLHFGLGAHGGPVRVTVRWNSGQETVFQGLAAGQYHTLHEAGAQ